MSRTHLSILLLLYLHTEALATDCTGLPTNETVRLRLQNLVSSGGGEVDAQITVEDGPFFTCLVQGTTMGTYQQLSVIAAYIVTSSSDTSVRVSQIEMDCTDIGGGDRLWNGRTGSLNTVDGSVDYQNLGVLTNCSECTEDATNDHHCEG